MKALRFMKLGGLALIVLLIVAQAFRIKKDNPAVLADLKAPALVKETLRRSCYDCHSNETVWRWYSNVAPVSWLVGNDVHEGRHRLNFSDWGNYSPSSRLKKLKEMGKEIAEGDMPPWYYVYPMHLEARLSAADRLALQKWIRSETAAPGLSAPPHASP